MPRLAICLGIIAGFIFLQMFLYAVPAASPLQASEALGRQKSNPNPVGIGDTAEAANTKPTLYYLTEGSRIQVEGTEFANGKLIATKITLVEDDDVEVEGIITQISHKQSELKIEELRVVATDSTEIVNRNRVFLNFTNLTKGMRVKVKIEHRKGKKFEAALIRYYPGAIDRDLELQGTVEKINVVDAELTVLGIPVLLTDETRHVNPPSDLGSSEARTSAERRIRREDDDPDQAPTRLGRLLLGGKAGIAYRFEDNFDLNENRDETSGRLTPGARLEVSLPIGEHSELYTKLSFSRGTELTDRNNAPDGFQFTVKEAFFYWGRFPHKKLALQIGRQRFQDRREWTYDDYLDAIRLHARLTGFRLEFAVAKGIFGNGLAREEQLYLMGSAEHRFSGTRRLRAYVVKRDDSTPRDENPMWWGLSSRGKLTRDSNYWAEGALMTGRRRQKKLEAFGFDLGGSYRFSLPWKPTVTAAFAYGTGDSNGGDGVDRNFRQTQLQDNTQRISGLKRNSYYGALLDPELSNLKIPSLQVGVRPFRNLSFDVVFHKYWQVEASRDVADWDLDALPNGRDTRLGKELDLVVAYRPGHRWDLTLLVGVFYPGPAFGNRASRALLIRPSFQFHY